MSTSANTIETGHSGTVTVYLLHCDTETDDLAAYVHAGFYERIR